MRRVAARAVVVEDHPQTFVQGAAAFRPMARLIRLIGAELISDEIVGVAELVKNSYDADATLVRVVFEGATGEEGRIRIEDDGHGMALDDLLDGWMRPGWTTKARERGTLSPGGRRLLGEKGIGRFAADKLARHLELRSRRPGAGVELRARFDWDRYDDLQLGLGDVKCEYETVPAAGEPWHGLRLLLRGLRTRWTERMFGRLASRLARLSPPYSASRDFAILLESDEFPDYGGEVGTRFLARAPYRLDLEFDGSDKLTWRLDGGSPQRERWVGPGSLMSGPVRILLHAYDLETSALSAVGPRTEVRAWLRAWSGISVYRDGFRVWPYGEPHDDWLRLDQRRVNNPTECLSNNQVVGFIEINRDRNPELIDQTNREGLVQNRAFEDLRRLALHAIGRLEEHRQAGRGGGPARGPELWMRGASAPHHSVLEELARLASRLEEGANAEIRRRIARAQRVLQRREAQLAAELGELADHAAAGLIRTYLSGMDGGRRARPRVADRWRGYGALLLPPARSRTVDVLAELEHLGHLFGEVEGLPRLRPAFTAQQLIRTEIEPGLFARLVFLLLMALSREGRGAATRPGVVEARATQDGEWCHLDLHRNGSGIVPRAPSRRRTAGFPDPLHLARRMAEGRRGRVAARAGQTLGPARVRLTLRAEAAPEPTRLQRGGRP